MYSSTHSLTSALDGGEWSASRPSRFTPRERASGTHWIGGCVGPRAVLDAVVKRKIPSPRRESNPRTPIVRSPALYRLNYAFQNYHAGIGQWDSGGLRAGRLVVRIPVWVGNFSPHHRIQTGSGAHPVSYPMGIRGSFPGSKAAGS
jgi:hypothetical protein